jgi:polyisoprenoid-binding protein YceI
MFVVALAVGCVEDVGKDRPVAEVQDVPASAPVAADSAAAGGLPVPALQAPSVLEIDPARSSLGALGAKITAKHPIDFEDFDGAVGLDGDTVTSVAFAAAIGTMESDHPKLTAHLKKQDFLWAERYPHATFVSTEVKYGSDQEGYTHTVTGDLTIRGKTRRVTFPANISVSATEVTAKTEFVVNRQDFEVTYPGKPDDLVQDNVVLQVAFVAARA